LHPPPDPTTLSAEEPAGDVCEAARRPVLARRRETVEAYQSLVAYPYLERPGRLQEKVAIAAGQATEAIVGAAERDVVVCLDN